MDDQQIIQLYNERSEAAISETAEKYGKYCHCIAYNILCDERDSEECVNDTYFITWNRIPPKMPERLSVFLGKITRNVAIDRYRYYSREKRGNGQTTPVLEELDECIPSTSNTEQAVSMKLLVEALNTFLKGLPVEKRKLFVRRYWYLSPIAEIADNYGISESKVRVTLFRTREKLRQFLEREGITL